MIWPICRVLSNSGSVPVFLALFTSSPGEARKCRTKHTILSSLCAPTMWDSARWNGWQLWVCSLRHETYCGHVFVTKNRHKIKMFDMFSNIPSISMFPWFFSGDRSDMKWHLGISATAMAAMVPSFGDRSLKVHSNRLSGHVESEDRKDRSPSLCKGRCADQLT